MSEERNERRDITRRAEDAMAFQLMTETRQMVREIEEAMDAKFDAISSELLQQRNTSEKDRAEMKSRIEHLSGSTLNLLNEQSRLIKTLTETVNHAFPDGDAESHCLAHEKWIEKARKEEEFWLDIKKKAVGSIVTGVILWAGIVLWSAFLNGPKP